MKRFGNNLCAIALAVTVVFFVSLDLGAAGHYEPQASQHQTSVQPETYLNLAIRIRNQEFAEVVRARIVGGKLIHPETPPSEYVYEVIRDRKTIVAGFLSQDAFISRTLANSKATERVDKAGSATIVINVPSFGSATNCNLEIRIYRIKSGESVEEITPSVMQQLRSQRRLCDELKIPAQKVCAAIARDNVSK